MYSCYVDDLVDGVVKLLFSDETQPVNIGNPDEISISDFANEIINLTGTTQKVVYRPLPENDPLKRRPDISKAEKILNWSPKIPRSEGLELTYDYFKNLSKDQLFEKEHNNFKNYIKF